jgi:transcriptional antiterminator RfaH
MERWLAVCCKPRQEYVAQENLVRQGFHVYLPRILIRRRLRGHWIDAIEVLFPRYIFLRINAIQKSIAPVRSTRGVVGLVCFGGQPAVVPDQVIATLIQRENPEIGLHQADQPLFSAGDPIRLVDGPLTGMKAIFEQEDSEQRVIVLLNLLGKSNKMKVSRDWIVQAA